MPGLVAGGVLGIVAELHPARARISTMKIRESFIPGFIASECSEANHAPMAARIVLRPRENEVNADIPNFPYFLLNIAAKASSLVRNCNTLPSIW
jgi:hypothetical protein